MSIIRSAAFTGKIVGWKFFSAFVLVAASLTVSTFPGVQQAQALAYSRTQPSTTAVNLLCGDKGTAGDPIFQAGVTITEDTGGRLFVLVGDKLTISAPALNGTCTLNGSSTPQFLPNQAMPTGEGDLWKMTDAAGAVVNLKKDVDAYSSLPITVEFLKAHANTLSWDFSFVTTFVNSVPQKVNSSVNIWSGVLDQQPEAPTNLSNAQHNATTQVIEASLDTPAISVSGYQYRIYPIGTTPTNQANPFLPSKFGDWQGIANFSGVSLRQLSNGTVTVPAGSLAAGSYVIELRAVKEIQPNTIFPTRAIWDMSASVTTTFTVADKPGAPTSLVATPGNGKVTINWAAPTNDGGSPIIEYRVAAVSGTTQVKYSASSDFCVVKAPTTSCTYTGLTNEVLHRFRVVAVNSVNSSKTFLLPADFNIAQVDATPSASIQESPNDSGTSGGTPSGDVATPTPSGATLALVTANEIAQLTQRTGVARAIIAGRVTQVDVKRLVVDGVSVEPSKRTPAQISSIRKAAQSLAQSFNAVAGTSSGITVRNTSTGAVVVGLVGAKGSKPSTPVPAEKVLLVSTSGGTILMASTDSAGLAQSLSANGSIVLNPKGSLVFALGGFAANAKGEVVLAQTGQVVSAFNTTADGGSTLSIVRPSSLSAGNHTLVIAAGNTRIGVGFSATSAVTELPETGGNIPLTTALFFVFVGFVLLSYSSHRRNATC